MIKQTDFKLDVKTRKSDTTALFDHIVNRFRKEMIYYLTLWCHSDEDEVLTTVTSGFLNRNEFKFQI